MQINNRFESEMSAFSKKTNTDQMHFKSDYPH